MAVEGRTHRPVIDYGKCDTCAICLAACPAGVMPEMRKEVGSLRGKVYSTLYTGLGDRAQKASPAPLCQQKCPIGQDVRGYMKLIAQKHHPEALELIRQTNPLPSVCGYVCHHPCETACVRGYLDDPLAIRDLKRFAADFAPGSVPPIREKNCNGKKVTVVGSGPAGLAAAWALAQNGYRAEVIESYHEPGGMLAWAIPRFRLPAEVLKRDIDYLLQMGITIRTGTRLGTDLTLSDLRAGGAQAVIIATGTQQSLKMNIENEDATEGSTDCLSFLKRCAAGEQVRPGNRVLVIGGGNAAVDSARTALRLGAGRVTIVYRRGLEQMPADKAEVEEALAEGVQIRLLTAPAGIVAAGGKVTGLSCVRTELRDLDGGGRPRPFTIQGSEFVVPADTIISAVGQQPEYSWMEDGLPLDITAKKTLAADRDTLQTGAEGVFAAGDVVNGPTTVVEAMASGKKAAAAVDNFLSGKS